MGCIAREIRGTSMLTSIPSEAVHQCCPPQPFSAPAIAATTCSWATTKTVTITIRTSDIIDAGHDAAQSVDVCLSPRRCW